MITLKLLDIHYYGVDIFGQNLFENVIYIDVYYDGH